MRSKYIHVTNRMHAYPHFKLELDTKCFSTYLTCMRSNWRLMHHRFCIVLLSIGQSLACYQSMFLSSSKNGTATDSVCFSNTFINNMSKYYCKITRIIRCVISPANQMSAQKLLQDAGPFGQTCPDMLRNNEHKLSPCQQDWHLYLKSLDMYNF